jgi:hypothetical protein
MLTPKIQFRSSEQQTHFQIKREAGGKRQSSTALKLPFGNLAIQIMSQTNKI